MKLQKSQRYAAAIVACLVVVSVFSFASPSVAQAQTGSDAALLDAIRAMLDDSYRRLSTEIQTLRAEVQQLQGGGSAPVTLPPLVQPTISFPDFFTRTLTTGDSGDEVRRLQEILQSLGFNIPAGTTGNFGPQTVNAIRGLQGSYNLPVTGVFDQATLNVVNRLFNNSPEVVPVPRIIQPQPQTPPSEPETPTITPSLLLISPSNNMLLGVGTKISIVWRSTYVPIGSKISFSLHNKQNGARRPILETDEISGTYEWTIPSNMNGDNEFTAEIIYSVNGSSPQILVSKAVAVSILGGGSEPTTVTPNNDYAAFYKGTAFTACMAVYPEAISLISGWADQGLSRYEFPWGELSLPAQNKVVVCEGDEFDDEPYEEYQDCLDNATESACTTQSGCTWFDTFCGNEGYDPGSGSSGSGGGGGTSEPYSCFYPSATINDQPPGFTVWCEYDYQNCREGYSSGAVVSLNGLALGAPSSCESGLNNGPTTAAPRTSFFGTVIDAFSRVFENLFSF